MKELRCSSLELLDTSFAYLTYLTKLNLDYCDFSHFNGDCFKHLPNVNHLTLDSPDNWNHVEFHQLINLDHLSIIVHLEDLTILEKFHTSIISLHVCNSIDSTNLNDFIRIMKRFTCLESLELELNDIQHFDINFLSENIKLKSFQIDQCSLKTINLDNNKNSSLSQLQIVQDLQLDSQNLTKFAIIENYGKFDFVNMLKNMSNLEILELEFCNLKQPKRDMFRFLKNLKNLSLTGNDIESLDDDVFADLIKLEKLNLSYNRLRQVRKETFSGLVYLRTLDFFNNPMNLELDQSIFADLKSLEQLEIFNDEDN